MSVKEFAPAIGMDVQDREGETSQDTMEAIFHDPATAPQAWHLLGPGRSQIDDPDGMNGVTGTTEVTVMDCVYFKNTSACGQRALVP